MGSSSNSYVQNTDNRLAVTDNAFGISNPSGKLSYGGNVFDFSTFIQNNGRSGRVVTSGAMPGGGGGIDIDILDGGAIQQAFEFAGNAIDAVAGEGFQNLLTTMTSQQDAALAQLDAIRTATNDKEGKVDQKTMVILGAIGLAFVFFMSRRK